MQISKKFNEKTAKIIIYLALVSILLFSLTTVYQKNNGFFGKHEITKLIEFKEQDIVIIDGDKKKRQESWKELKKSRFLIIVNYKNMTTSDYEENKLDKINLDCLIFDEISKIKNMKSDVYKQCKKLKTRKKIGLTATPIKNETKDLYSIISILRPDLLGSYQHFKRHYEGQSLAKMLGVLPGVICWSKESALHELPRICFLNVRIQLLEMERSFYASMI